MIAIKASTKARTPKMMVPVESDMASVWAGIAVGLMDGWDFRVVLVLRADMVAMIVVIRVLRVWNLSAASRMGNGMMWQM